MNKTILKPLKDPAFVLLLTLRPFTKLSEISTLLVDGLEPMIRKGVVVKKIYNHGVGPTSYPIGGILAVEGKMKKTKKFQDARVSVIL